MVDLKELNTLIAKTTDATIVHSTPEAYVRELTHHADRLPEFRGALNPCMVGCYTSQIRIKQEHRRLESDLYQTEKMCAAAMVQCKMPYPQTELDEAQEDLLTAAFHDILPGSAIQPVEEASLRMMGHGRTILSRLRARAFFALAAAQPKTPDGQIPVFVYNQHPYPVKTLVCCEFQLADQNWGESFTDLEVWDGHTRVPAQVEKEASNLNLDWRKRVVFAATLKPGQMSRFLCRPVVRPARALTSLQLKNGAYRIKTEDLDVRINLRTGGLDRYRVNGKDVLAKGACLSDVIADNSDPWKSSDKKLGKVCGKFRLLSGKDAAAFCGVSAKTLAPVRVVEDGAARVVIEALFGYGSSRMVLRYAVPRHGTQVEVDARVYWHETDKALKLRLPMAFAVESAVGEGVYCIEPLAAGGEECVSQRWLALTSRDGTTAFSCINDGIYASDRTGNCLRLTLLRSAAYSALPIGSRPLVPEDRHTARIDQGERHFRFWLNAGPTQTRMDTLPREAQAMNEAPFALSFFPEGKIKSTKAPAMVRLSDASICLTALKRANEGRYLIVRLVEPTGEKRTATFELPALGVRKRLAFTPFEIKTLRISLQKKTLEEVAPGACGAML